MILDIGFLLHWPPNIFTSKQKKKRYISILYDTKELQLLSCQPRVTVKACFIYKVIRALESIDPLCIVPIHIMIKDWLLTSFLENSLSEGTGCKLVSWNSLTKGLVVSLFLGTFPVRSA